MSGSAEQGTVASSVASFLDDLASSAPTPGGGAAAALAGAMAAALVSMVARLTIGRPRYEPVEAAMAEILQKAESFRRDLTRLVDDDAKAYAAVTAAYRLPRATAEQRAERSVAVKQSLAVAALPPAEVLVICRAIVPLCLQVAAHGNSSVASDAGIAAELARAGVCGSTANVRVNLAELGDPAVVEDFEARIRAAEVGLSEDLDRVTALVRAKIARKAMP